MDENELLNMLANSKIRREILLYLDSSPKTLSEIRGHLDVSASQMSIKLKELLEHNLIVADKKTVSLTPQGRVIMENYKPFANTAAVFDKLGEYWLIHDLDRVPNELRYRLGELAGADCIECDVSDMNRLKKYRDDAMKNAGWILSASPIFDEETAYMVFDLCKRGITIDIITSEEVVDRVKNGYSRDVTRILEIPNFSLYSTTTSLETPFILTDKSLYFSTYFKDGKADLQFALVGSDPATIRWGKDLYAYYLKSASKVKM
jgi:predicted transcriptional regulator